MIGFKITFVSTAIAVIAANSDKVPIQLLAIPAFAAIFFDLLIVSFSNSIKRIGIYCHDYLTKVIKQLTNWPEDILLWEEFLRKYKFGQTHALMGNLGITALSIGIAIFGLFSPFVVHLSIPFSILLIVFFFTDIIEMWKSSRKRQFE